MRLFRFDPNAVWSTEQVIRFGQAIEGLRNHYFEDPVFGLNGMRRTRAMVRIPLATNTVVVNFEQLGANVLNTAADVILLDTTFRGGIRACHYHHLTDDIIQSGLMQYENGAIRIPHGPGPGVKLDRNKLRQYSELYRRLGHYPYDQDPARPGWTPLVPNDRWADPANDKPVRLPF